MDTDTPTGSAPAAPTGWTETIGWNETNPTPLDVYERAWGIIANASGGDWSKQPEQWQRAAEAFRDTYQRAITSRGSAPAAPTTADDFEAWFVENYPPGTIISDPAWHAERIARFWRASLADARRQLDEVRAITEPLALILAMVAVPAPRDELLAEMQRINRILGYRPARAAVPPTEEGET
jgi:hypothetical protein